MVDYNEILCRAAKKILADTEPHILNHRPLIYMSDLLQAGLTYRDIAELKSVDVLASPTQARILGKLQDG